jgi:hypothetical protein
MRRLYLSRYQSDAEFRADEALRKKQWYHRKQAKIVAAYRKKRKKIRAARKLVKIGKPVHCVDLAFPSLPQGVPALF